jgi:acyl-coenzyme A synthetase/AMP-(fatty) acid ligase
MYNISNGGMLVTLNNRSPEEVASYIENYKIELLPVSPSFLNMILYSRIYERFDLSSLKIISYGTEPMPESTLKMVHHILPNVSLKQTYGLSEVGIVRTKSESSDSLWLKVGGDEEHQIKIVDGILYIKSKMSMIGYLNAPSPFDKDGWMNTKDRVEQRGEFIKILGRDSELINVGGEKVYPAEVESVLLEVNGVKDAVVGKMSNPILGSVVTCKIATDENIDLVELKKSIQQHCVKRLEKFKRPVKIEFQRATFNSSRFKRLR